MDIKTASQPPYIPDVAPCDFWLFPKLRDCRYETIEKMKEAVTEVIDTFTQDDFHEAFQKLLEQCVLLIKLPIRKKSGNLFNEPCIYKIDATHYFDNDLLLKQAQWW